MSVVTVVRTCVTDLAKAQWVLRILLAPCTRCILRRIANTGGGTALRFHSQHWAFEEFCQA